MRAPGTIDYPPRPMRVVRCALAVLFAASVLASPVMAQDGPRCAVLPLDGSGSVVVRRSLMRSIEEHGGVTVIDEDEVDSAAEGGASPHVVADRTHADLVISGEVSGRGARRTLSLEATDAEGRVLATAEIRLRTGGAGRRALDEGVADLLDAALPDLTRDEAPAEREVRPEPEPEARRDRRREEPEPYAFGVDPHIFTIRVGLVVRTRDARVNVAGGNPRSWRADPAYVELWAGLELRPLARSRDYWRGLFLRGDVAIAAGLGSRDERGGTVATEFFRFSGDLGYLVPIGDVVELGGSFGGGFDAYHLGTNTLFPGVELPYVRPGLRGRIRALGETIVISADFGYRAVVARSELSAAFGGGDTHGIDVSGGISGVIELGPDVGGVAYGVEVGWAGLWHSFSGGGVLANGESGSEEGLRVLVSGGWSI